MGLFDFLGFGSDGSGLGSSLGSFITDTALGWMTAGMDSLGLTQHGRDQYFARDMQREFLDKQMAFQREMTANQQNFTREMYNQQWQDNLSKYPLLQKSLSDIAFNNWRQQFDTQNTYNSYQNQIGRMLAAGINPNSLYGNSGGLATSSMSPLSAAAPPQISATPFQSHASPIGLPTGFSNPRQFIGEIGSFLRDLGQAKKLGVETDQLEKLFDLEVQERSTRIFGQKLTNEAMSIANYVADKIKDVKVRKATEELVNLIANTKNVDADTAKKLQEKLTSKSEELLNLAKKRCEEENFEVLKFKVNNLPKEFQTWVDTQRSMQVANQAQARFNNAMAETENQLRSGKVTCQTLSNQLLKIQRDLAQMEYDEKDATFTQRVIALIQQFKRESLITDNMYQDLMQNKIRTKWADRLQFMQYWTGFFGAAAQVLGGVGSAAFGLNSIRNTTVNDLNMQERNRIADRFNDIYGQSVDQQRYSPKTIARESLGPFWDSQSGDYYGR